MINAENMKRKYPRTYHFAWSPGTTSDDCFIEDMSVLENCADVVMTIKMDGENTTIYPTGEHHARSMDSGYHPSRENVAEIAGMIGSSIPEGYRICGENLWARHSITYNDLPSYFQMFNMWKGDTCLSWDETVEWSELLDVKMVPELYRGPWLGMEGFEKIFYPHRDTQEGYVVRIADSFHRNDFSKSVGKWVRSGHVQTAEHWMHGTVVRNEIAGK